MNLKEKITAERIAAMKARNTSRSTIVNSILAAIKQVEIDTRVSQDDIGVLTILNKMVKQRMESIAMFNAAGRIDLSDVEETELTVIKEFMPTQASEAEIASVISEAVEEVKASTDSKTLTVKDMGKIMAIVKPKLHGKADMSTVSVLIKSKLS